MSLFFLSLFCPSVSSVIKGATSHKTIDLSGNPILRIYYTSRVNIHILKWSAFSLRDKDSHSHIDTHLLCIKFDIQIINKCTNTLSSNSNPLSVVYFSPQPVLFFMCMGNELFYCLLYVIYYIEEPQGESRQWLMFSSCFLVLLQSIHSLFTKTLNQNLWCLIDVRFPSNMVTTHL